MVYQSPTRIVVLGAERSGASLVTDMIHRWGAYAGPPDKLTGPSEHSPQGQWEYQPLWDLLVEIWCCAQRAKSCLPVGTCAAAHALLCWKVQQAHQMIGGFERSKMSIWQRAIVSWEGI